MDPPVYDLLTSTRYDRHLLALGWNRDDDEPSPFLILPYHYERLADAARHHGWTQAIANFPSYSTFKSEAYQAVNNASDTSAEAYKVRAIIDGIYLSNSEQLSPCPGPIYTVSVWDALRLCVADAQTR